MGRPEADLSIDPTQGAGTDAAGDSLLASTRAQMETLERLLLETTESAAAAMLSETREEGQRRIDEAAERANTPEYEWVPPEAEAVEPEAKEADESDPGLKPPESEEERQRSSSFRALEGIRREFLLAQVSGAVVGLAGGAALVRFVIL